MSSADRTMWAVADRVATLFTCAAMEARARMLSHASPLMRLMGQRDALHREQSLLEREMAIFRSQRLRKPPKQRSHYAPEERAEILQLMRLRGWSLKEAGERFVVHPNTIRNWQKAVDAKLRSDRLIGGPPWNRVHDGVRWLIHEIRESFPEPEFGTRTIARHILRAGIRVSRTTIRRVLQEDAPKPTKKDAEPAHKTEAPPHVQHPRCPNQAWHLDITSLRVLWKRFEIAAVIDGFTRKIVALRVFGKRPGSNDLASLVDSAAVDAGTQPRFLVTDHGSQFRRRFRSRVEVGGSVHIRCQVHTWHLNAKAERIFRDLKHWAKRSSLVPNTDSIQQRLDAFRTWHNGFKPHAAHDTLTPIEAERGASRSETKRYFAKGDAELSIRLCRRCVRGDPRLCYPVIHITEHRRDVA